MSPVPGQVPPTEEQQKDSSYMFVYKDKEYDCTEYAKKHPGGEIFFTRMKEEKKDFTEYFRMLHSKKALKILKAQPVVQTVQESEHSKQYTTIKKKVKPFMKPIWQVEVALTLMLLFGLYLGVTDNCWWRSIPTLALVQIISGWVAHSQNHSRHFYVWKFSTALGVVNGLSTKWWQYKHNNHHVFTNRIGKDDDINHHYAQWQYCFLYLKWKVDSLIQTGFTMQSSFLVLHWVILLQQNIFIMIVSQMLGGWFSANILIGNHERETLYFTQIDKPFLEHQISATRNYNWTGTTTKKLYLDYISLMLMGGMQYQTEHHMFPQIPFYRLPWASIVIRQELAKIGLQVKVDSIF